MWVCCVGELWLPLYTSNIFRALFSLKKLIITYPKKKIHHLLVFEIPTFCGQICQPTIDSHNNSHEKCVPKNRYEAGREWDTGPPYLILTKQTAEKNGGKIYIHTF